MLLDDVQKWLVDKSKICFARTTSHHVVVEGLGHRVPRLVILDMAVVGMVRAVADAPAVVGDQDGGVGDVAHQVVERLVVGKALVAAGKKARVREAATEMQSTYQSWPTTKSAQNMVPWANQ